MKQNSKLAIAFLLCFVLGFGLITLAPPTTAGSIDPCSTTCYRDYCPGPVGGSCESPYVNKSRCYAEAKVICSPEFTSFNCRCEWIGCCIPF